MRSRSDETGELKDLRFVQMISQRIVKSRPQKLNESVNEWHYWGFGLNELGFDRRAAIVVAGDCEPRVSHDNLMKISDRDHYRKLMNV